MVMVLMLSLLAVNGCKKEPDNTRTATAMKAIGTIQLCSDCGMAKGTELCCKPGQEKCPKCGLIKGSPGCCKIPE